MSEAQIAQAFEANQLHLESDDVAAQCTSLATTYSLSAGDLVEAYEAFTFSRGELEGTVTAKLLEGFQKHLQQPHVKKTPPKPVNTSALGRGGWGSHGVLEDQTNSSLLGSLETPKRPVISKPGGPPTHEPVPSAFKNRPQAGSVVTVLNGHLDLDCGAEAMEVDGGAERCVVQLVGEALPLDQKYMVEKLEDKAAYLESRIQSFAGALEAQEGRAPSHPVAATCQTPELCVGRICCDSEGRLNEQSVVLEGGGALSEGRRVRLDLSAAAAFRLFPGQTVGVRGLNPSGQCLLAQQLLCSAPLPMPSSTVDELAHFAAATGKEGISMVAAAGPYTTPQNTLYEPLHALLEVCTGQPPDVLLLLGPFVDEEHPDIKSGSLPVTFQQLFETQVLQPLAEFCGRVPGTHVVLVPSTRDVHHHPVFPQPAFNLANMAFLPANRITSLPNPCTFRCNEVVLGCVTSDVVRQLAGQDIQRSQQKGDRMLSLAGHLLAQRSFYPLYPAAVGAMLDTTLTDALELRCSPDVMVLPSDLTHYAKLLPLGAGSRSGGDPSTSAISSIGVGPEPKVVCINPGRVGKGNNGGTFARMRVAASAEGLAAASGQPPGTNATIAHAVDQRCRVEIRKV